MLKRQELDRYAGKTGKFIIRRLVELPNQGTKWTFLKNSDGSMMTFTSEATAARTAAELNEKFRPTARHWSEAEMAGSDYEWTA